MSTLKSIISQISTKVRKSLPVIHSTPVKPRTYKDASSPKPGAVLPRYVASEGEEELVVVDDYTKQCVLATSMYHEYIDKMTVEYQANPEFMQRVRDITDLVNEDKPVKKTLLFQTFDELFQYEHTDLHSAISAAERYKHLGLPEDHPDREQIELQTEVLVHEHRASKEQVLDYVKLEDASTQAVAVYSAKPSLEEDKVFSPREIKDRFYYIFNQIKLTFQESAETIGEYSEKMGSVFAAMNYIVLKENRTEEEQKVMDGFQYICRLMLEHERYKTAVQQHYIFNMTEPFPMSDYLRKRYLDTLNDFLTTRYIPDFNRAVGIPDNTHKQLIDQRLREQKAVDFDALFQKDRRSAVKLIADKGEDMLVRRDLTAKDDQLIRKMNFLADSLEVKSPPKIELDFGLDDNSHGLKERMIAESRAPLLSTDNLVKLLYLNNADPVQFNLEYWCDTLLINPQKLKNILYNFSVPVLGETDPEFKLEFTK